MPSWGAHSRTTSPAATTLTLEEVYFVTYSLPKPHFPLSLTSPQPLEVSFSLFCLFLSPLAKVPMWIMTKSARVELVSRNKIWDSQKRREMTFYHSPPSQRAWRVISPPLHSACLKDKYLVSSFFFFSLGLLQRPRWQESDRERETCSGRFSNLRINVV